MLGATARTLSAIMIRISPTSGTPAKWLETAIGPGFSAENSAKRAAGSKGKMAVVLAKGNGPSEREVPMPSCSARKLSSPIARQACVFTGETRSSAPPISTITTESVISDAS